MAGGGKEGGPYGADGCPLLPLSQVITIDDDEEDDDDEEVDEPLPTGFRGSSKGRAAAAPASSSAGTRAAAKKKPATRSAAHQQDRWGADDEFEEEEEEEEGVDSSVGNALSIRSKVAFKGEVQAGTSGRQASGPTLKQATTREAAAADGGSCAFWCVVVWCADYICKELNRSPSSKTRRTAFEDVATDWSDR